MSKVIEKQKLNIDLQIPQFSVMRITPPAKLEPLKMSSLQFDYENSQYEPFSLEILQKIGVKFDQNNGIFSSLVSDLSCVNCTACKAISKDTLMQIDQKNFQRTQKKPIITQEKSHVQEEVVDEDKKQRYKQIWENYKKKHIRPSKVKFEVAFKQYHNLPLSQWEQKVKFYFN